MTQPLYLKSDVSRRLGVPAHRPPDRLEVGAADSVPQPTSDPYQDGTFTIRRCGQMGQEIVDPDGRILAWTTNEWIAQVLCRLCNEQETLFCKGML